MRARCVQKNRRRSKATHTIFWDADGGADWMKMRKLLMGEPLTKK